MSRLTAICAFAYCLLIATATSQVLPPGAPVATAPTNVGQNSFSANWNASTGATTYLLTVATDTIFRLVVPGFSNLNVGPALTQSVTGLSPGTTYYYRLKASNAGGVSGNSNSITVTTVVATPPAPVATKGTNILQTSFTANWDSSAGATAYFLDVSTDTNFISIVPGYGNLNAGDVNAWNVVGVAGGTKYFYRVRGGNVGGTSGSSNVISLITVVATPLPPVATPGTAVTQTSLTANWNPSAGATTYFLDVASDTSFTAILPAYNNLNAGNLLSQSVTGLAPGTKYYYRVRGSNVGGTSGSSNIVSVTTVVAAPPAPVATAASSVGQTTFTAAWNAAAGATTYFVDVAADTGFASLLPGFNNLNAGNVLTQNVGGLSPGTKYFYRVRAGNPGGTSSSSNVVSVITVVAAPSAPLAAAASNILQTSFAANWNPSTGATAYLLDVAADTAFTSILPAYTNLNVGNGLTRIVTGLSPGTKYSYRVRANNAGGTSGNSNVVSATTVVATPPAPVATAALNIGQTSFTANWNASPGATAYSFDAATDTAFTAVLSAYTNLNVGNVLSQTVTGLASGSRYYYRVRGGNASGTSVSSNVISVTTAGVLPQAPVLTAPANGSAGQPTTVTLGWNPSPGAASYVVQVSTAPTFVSAFINDTAVASNSRPLTPLAPNTTYYWRVAGKNQFGSGAFSSPPFSFSTLAAASVSGGVAFPENPVFSDYRMVSIPGIPTGTLSELTAGSGGMQEFDWRAFRVSDAGLLAELKPQDQLNAGEGVWLIRKNPLSITKSSTMPPLQANGTFAIQIHDGWNIVANPFNVPVQWAAVRAQNGLLFSDVIQGWLGTYAVDSVMEPFRGYYFFNTNPGTTTLAIPYPLPSTQHQASYVLPVIAWSLHVSFETPENIDTDCHLGVSPAAAAGHDSLAIRKPPLAFAGGEVYFSRPDPEGKSCRFSTDYRPAFEGSGQWDIVLSRPGGCNGILRFEGLDAIPADYRVVLVTPDEGWPIDLRSQKSYKVQTPVTAVTVKILIGSASDVQHALAALLPASFSLAQNFPNPFNPATTIRYGLPVRSIVNLALFNAIGQQVRQLASGEEEAGFHEVKFDGSGISSGVYFYRLRAGGFTETKKFLLIR